MAHEEKWWLMRRGGDSSLWRSSGLLVAYQVVFLQSRVGVLHLPRLYGCTVDGFSLGRLVHHELHLSEERQKQKS